MNHFDHIRQVAESVRNIELVCILEYVGAIQDKKESCKWNTSKGTISVSGQKFYNWSGSIGGGGAIDLIMHLENIDFNYAIGWLIEHFFVPNTPPKRTRCKSVVLPQKNPDQLPVVVNYLTAQRCLPFALINSLISAGKIYADDRANAVFVLMSKKTGIVGAEIRGTMTQSWHAMAPGSRKDLGCFYVKTKKTQKVVICESAIDAISYHALDPESMALSTAGAHPSPHWLDSLIERQLEVYCGFDADSTGDKLAQRMITLYPTVKRLRPPKHDWNDVIKDQDN